MGVVEECEVEVVLLGGGIAYRENGIGGLGRPFPKI